MTQNTSGSENSETSKKDGDKPPAPKKEPSYRVLLDEFMVGSPSLKNALQPHGACLLAAHCIADLGSVKASKMTAAEARAYADTLYKFQPQAWGACARSDVLNLVLMLEGARIEHGTWKEYQAQTARLMQSLYPTAA
jgi:hypothetical protein